MSGLLKQFANVFIDTLDRSLDNFLLVSKQIVSFCVSGPLYLFNCFLYASVLAYYALTEEVGKVKYVLLVSAIYAALIPLSYWSCVAAIFLSIFYGLFGPKLEPVNYPPKILENPKYGKHKYASLPGITLHYVENGDPNKPIMLFLHGFNEFWFTWRNQIVEFSGEYRTIAVDLRGFGDSDKPSSINSYKLSILINDLKNFIEYINPDQKQKLFIVARGWGAVILYCFLLDYGRLVNAYVTLNIVPPYVMRLSIRQIIDSWKVYLFQVPIIAEIFIKAHLPKFLTKTYDELDEYDKEDAINSYYYVLSKPGAYKCPLYYFRANLVELIQYRLYGSEKLIHSQIPPGMCLYGQDDETLDENSFLHSNLVPNLQTVKVLQAGFKMTELQPKVINQLIRIFMKTLKRREDKHEHDDKLKKVSKRSWG